MEDSRERQSFVKPLDNINTSATNHSDSEKNSMNFDDFEKVDDQFTISDVDAEFVSAKQGDIFGEKNVTTRADTSSGIDFDPLVVGSEHSKVVESVSALSEASLPIPVDETQSSRTSVLEASAVESTTPVDLGSYNEVHIGDTFLEHIPFAEQVVSTVPVDFSLKENAHIEDTPSDKKPTILVEDTACVTDMLKSDSLKAELPAVRGDENSSYAGFKSPESKTESMEKLHFESGGSSLPRTPPPSESPSPPRAQSPPLLSKEVLEDVSHDVDTNTTKIMPDPSVKSESPTNENKLLLSESLVEDLKPAESMYDTPSDFKESLSTEKLLEKEEISSVAVETCLLSEMASPILEAQKYLFSSQKSSTELEEFVRSSEESILPQNPSLDLKEFLGSSEEPITDSFVQLPSDQQSVSVQEFFDQTFLSERPCLTIEEPDVFKEVTHISNEALVSRDERPSPEMFVSESVTEIPSYSTTEDIAVISFEKQKNELDGVPSHGRPPSPMDKFEPSIETFTVCAKENVFPHFESGSFSPEGGLEKDGQTDVLSPCIDSLSEVGVVYQGLNVSSGHVTMYEETKKCLALFTPRAWFHPDQLDPQVVELIYWRDLKKTGIVFGIVMVLLLSLVYFSLISVVAYTSLFVLIVTLIFRIYKNIAQAVQKSADGHPFKAYLDSNTDLPSDKVHEAVDFLLGQFNSTVAELKRLFLVEDIIDSVRFGCLLWVLTYVGAWFNGLTLVILSVVALFTLPKVYETHKTQIDQYIGLARSQVNEIMTKIKGALPIGNKEKSQ